MPNSRRKGRSKNQPADNHEWTATQEMSYLTGGPEALFGVTPIWANQDEAEARMITGAWMLGPDGRPYRAAIAVAVDDVLGAVAVARRPSDRWPVSTELSIDFGAPPPTDGSALCVHGRLGHEDGDDILADGRVTTETGELVATCTERLRHIPADTAALLRPATRMTTKSTALERADAPHPLIDLLDVAFEHLDAVSILRITATWQLANPRGLVHGGTVCWLSEVAAKEALQSQQRSWVTASVRTTYIRPLPVGPLSFTAFVAHAGRTLGVVNVTSNDLSGKPCTFSTVTLQSARPASIEQRSENASRQPGP